MGCCLLTQAVTGDERKSLRLHLEEKRSKPPVMRMMDKAAFTVGVRTRWRSGWVTGMGEGRERQNWRLFGWIGPWGWISADESKQAYSQPCRALTLHLRRGADDSARFCSKYDRHSAVGRIPQGANLGTCCTCHSLWLYRRIAETVCFHLRAFSLPCLSHAYLGIDDDRERVYALGDAGEVLAVVLCDDSRATYHALPELRAAEVALLLP